MLFFSAVISLAHGVDLIESKQITFCTCFLFEKWVLETGKNLKFVCAFGFLHTG